MPPNDDQGREGDGDRYTVPMRFIVPQEMTARLYTESDLKVRDMEARQGSWAFGFFTASASAALCFAHDLYESWFNFYVFVLFFVLVALAIGSGLIALKFRAKSEDAASTPPTSTLGLRPPIAGDGSIHDSPPRRKTTLQRLEDIRRARR